MYKLNDTVVKISSRPGNGDRFIDVGARGQVIRMTPPPGDDREDYPYLLVRFAADMMNGINGGSEWCYESELVRLDAYDQFEKENGRKPVQADVTGNVDGVQLLELYPEGAFTPIVLPPSVGEIVGDGPTPHYDLASVPVEEYERIKIGEIAPPVDPEFVLMPERNGSFTWVVYLNDSQIRKMLPVGTVTTEYFPLGDRGAAAVAWIGNEKHRPGLPLGWSRGISDDHENALLRHLQDMKAPGADGWDTVELPDGRIYQYRHASAVAWRARAIAQLDAEANNGQVIRRLK